MKLKEARLEAGLGRNRLAKLTGFDRPSLFRYETGRQRPTFETVVRICRGLELDRETILKIDEFKHITVPLVDLGWIEPPGGEGSPVTRENDDS